MKTSALALALLLAISLCGCTRSGNQKKLSREPEISESTTISTETSEESSETMSDVADGNNEELLYNPDIRNLKWGMSVEEVIAHEPEKASQRQHEQNSAGIWQTLLTYEDIEFRGYKTEMVLCVFDETGLEGVNYHIYDSSYYNTLYNELLDEFGEPSENYNDSIYATSGSCTWKFPDQNLYIFILGYGDLTQISYFPLNDMSGESDSSSGPDKNSTPDKPDIRNLNWGMPVEEVIANEPEKTSNREDEYIGYGIKQTLLTYENIEFRGFSTKMVLNVTDKEGLKEVSYQIPDSEYFTEAFDEFFEEYGMPTNGLSDSVAAGRCCIWNMPEDGMWVFLLKGEDYTEISYHPLSEDDLTDDNFDCPVDVILNDMYIVNKDVNKGIENDYASFEFEITNYEGKDIKKITGAATFYDNSGNELLTGNCVFINDIPSGGKIIDDSMALDLYEQDEDDMALKNTPFKDILFEYIVYEIEYSDGSVVSY